MGIRYDAYRVERAHVAHARKDPRFFIADDPLADAWALDGRAKPRMLYLDKSWRLLQRVTWPGPDVAPRVSHRLSEGGVTDVPGAGWLPLRALHRPRRGRAGHG